MRRFVERTAACRGGGVGGGLAAVASVAEVVAVAVPASVVVVSAVSKVASAGCALGGCAWPVPLYRSGSC